MSHKIPGFSFWALLTAAIIFVILWRLPAPPVLTIGVPVLWYLVGVGVAYASRKFHFPDYEQFITVSDGQLASGTTAPEGMLTVVFSNQHKAMFVPPKSNLRKIANAQGVKMYYDITNLTNCRGLGLCGTCRFAPDQKNPSAFSDLTWQEKFTLGDNAGKLRLACQTSILGDCTIDNTAAKEIGEVHHYAVINGVLFGAFSLAILAAIVWIGADMIGLL